MSDQYIKEDGLQSVNELKAITIQRKNKGVEKKKGEKILGLDEVEENLKKRQVKNLKYKSVQKQA